MTAGGNPAQIPPGANPAVYQNRGPQMAPPPQQQQQQPPLLPQQPGDLNAQFNNMSLDAKPMQTHAGILDPTPPGGQPPNGFYNRRYNQSYNNSPRMDYGGNNNYRGGYNNGYNNNNNSGGARDHFPGDWGRPSPADPDLEL